MFLSSDPVPKSPTVAPLVHRQAAKARYSTQKVTLLFDVDAFAVVVIISEYSVPHNPRSAGVFMSTFAVITYCWPFFSYRRCRKKKVPARDHTDKGDVNRGYTQVVSAFHLIPPWFIITSLSKKM